MITLAVRNVNFALWAGARLLEGGHACLSRQGEVVVAAEPVTTVYERPRERVLLLPLRDANPFFHLFEALWMLAGRNDLAPLIPFVKQMAQFSDDGGKTQPGAYGWRWVNHFGTDRSRDQVDWAIKRLRRNLNDRRVVIQMYDPDIDQDAADSGGRDIPCNLCALPSLGVDGRLNLTVYNRSNDIVWGAYGANAVHFSVLQELLAAGVGAPVGRYYQVSNNFHGYISTLTKAGEKWPWPAPSSDAGLPNFMPQTDPYTLGEVQPEPMFSGPFNLDSLREDLDLLLDDPGAIGIRSRFLRKVAGPMFLAHKTYKKDGSEAAREVLKQMPQKSDWRAGAELWLNNRDQQPRKIERS